MSEIDDLLARARGLDRDLASAEADHTAAVEAHTRAQDEVGSLRLPRWAALKALLTGRLGERREAAEIAERDAGARVASAGERIQRVRRQREDTRRSLDRAYGEAAAAVERRDRATYDALVARGDPRAAELDAAGVEQSRTEDRIRELAEASAAVAGATDAVREAERRLSSARDWGTYDTWFGGGMLSSAVKHDRIDDAKDALQQVSTAVDRAQKELADVAVALRSTGIERTDDWRGFDIWFDNFFSDWATQTRIQDSLAGVQRLSAELGRVGVALSEERTRAQEQRARLVAGRRAILDAAAADVL